MLGRSHTLPLFGETMRNWNFMTFLEIPVSGHFGNDALFLNRCSNGTCRSLWKESNVRELLNRLRAQEVTPHKLQLCWDTLRWFAKKFGLLAVQEEHRLLQKKQTVETGLTPAVVQPARKAKVPPKEVIWALEEGAAGVPLLPGANSLQEKGAYAPRELDTFILGIVRYQVGCSARFNDLQHTAPPLWSIQLPPSSSQHGRPRQSVPHGSGNIRCPWFVQSIPSQAMHGGNLYLHGGPASLSIQALRKVTISSPPSARMAWASSPGLARLIEPFVGWKMHWGEGEFPHTSFRISHGTASASSSQTVPFNSESPGIRGDTWATGWPNQQLMFTPERSATWLSRYGMKWRTTSRRSPWEDEWSGKTWVILTGRACPWLSHPHQRRVWRTPYLVNLWKKTSPSSLHLKINHHLC